VIFLVLPSRVRPSKFTIAFKTGTSYGYRGAWSVGLDSRRQCLVDPPGPGFVRLSVLDAAGAVDTVVVRIQ